MNNNIITQIGEKQVDGSIVYRKIGAEMKYIRGQQNGNANNLEEQLMIGTDNDNTTNSQIVVPVEVPENPGVVEAPYRLTINTIKYKKENSDNDYYIMEKTIKTELNAKYEADTKKIVINLSPRILEKTEELSFYKDGVTTPESRKLSVYTYDDNTQESNVLDIVGNV